MCWLLNFKRYFLWKMKEKHIHKLCYAANLFIKLKFIDYKSTATKLCIWKPKCSIHSFVLKVCMYRGSTVGEYISHNIKTASSCFFGLCNIKLTTFHFQSHSQIQIQTHSQVKGSTTSSWTTNRTRTKCNISRIWIWRWRFSNVTRYWSIPIWNLYVNVFNFQLWYQFTFAKYV